MSPTTPKRPAELSEEWRKKFFKKTPVDFSLLYEVIVQQLALFFHY